MREIRLEHEIQAPAPLLWDTLTVYEILKEWLADEVRGRPKLGGEFTWAWNLGEQGVFETKGIYESIDPGKSIQLRWKNHPAGDVFLRLELWPIDAENTKLIIINGDYPDSSSYDNFIEGARDGWNDQVKRLKNYLEKNKIVGGVREKN